MIEMYEREEAVKQKNGTCVFLYEIHFLINRTKKHSREIAYLRRIFSIKRGKRCIKKLELFLQMELNFNYKDKKIFKLNYFFTKRNLKQIFCLNYRKRIKFILKYETKER